MRLTRLALATALALTFGTYAHAQTCGEICTEDYWKTAAPAEISKAIATVDVNAGSKYGWTPLHYAAGWGNTQNILTLLKAGADVNARGEDGLSPLHIAAGFSRNPQNILPLLEAGADVSARGEIGWTPLHMAAFGRTPENILTLLEADADATVKDILGTTPWDAAKDNRELKGTAAYWALNDARFK